MILIPYELINRR